MNISELGEFGLIERIKDKFKELKADGCTSIGDDCAVLPFGEGRSMVVTTDMLLEGVHFLETEISAYDLGRKALAVNLSDVASMGASPFCTFLSIALPKGQSVEWCDAFMDGYRSWGVPLLGGDTTSSINGVVVNVTAMGLVDNDCLKLRSAARSGDRVVVTAQLGDSAAGLRAVLENKKKYGELIATHCNPSPYVEQGQWLGRRAEVGAMMDVSDGVASDLGHILRASSAVQGVALGATLDLPNVPLSDNLRRALECETSWDAMSLALGGGEDYCLLLTVSNDKVEQLKRDYFETFGQKLYDIGCVDLTGKINYKEHGGLLRDSMSGFRHF